MISLVIFLLFSAHGSDDQPGDIELGELSNAQDLTWTLLGDARMEESQTAPLSISTLNEMLVEIRKVEVEVEQTAHTLENEQASTQQHLQTSQKRGPILKQHIIKANFYLLVVLNAAGLIYYTVVEKPNTVVIKALELAIPLLALIPFGKIDANLAEESQKLITRLEEITEKKVELNLRKEQLQRERQLVLDAMQDSAPIGH